MGKPNLQNKSIKYRYDNAFDYTMGKWAKSV